MCGEEFMFCVNAGSLGWLVMSHTIALFVGVLMVTS